VLFASRPAPVITSLQPQSAYHGSALDSLISDQSIEILGQNFQPTPLVELINANDPSQVYRATAVQMASSTRTTAVVPSETEGMPVGVYWVRLSNPDGQSTYWEVDAGGGLVGRGLFRITDVPGPRITELSPARPSQGLFPMTFAGNNRSGLPANGSLRRP